MSERDFEIGGKKLKLNKMDVFEQFHLVRKMGPFLSDLIPGMKGAVGKDVEKLSEAEKLDLISKFLGPFLTGFSKLSKEDSESVFHSLLHSVEIQQSTGNWMRISTGSMLMDQTLELPILMKIAGRAFMFNLTGFLTALQTQ